MDDLIRRQDALDAFGLSEKTRKYGGNHSGYNTMMLYEIQDVIEGLPSVNPQASNEDIHREREQAYMKGYEDASKRYRTEPCEDAISRQSVIKGLTSLAKARAKSDAQKSMMGRAMLFVERLPSVSTEKVGCWVEIDDEPHEVWECDHCGFVIDGSGCIDPYEYKDIYKYCPNCGAKMEVEE